MGRRAVLSTSPGKRCVEQNLREIVDPRECLPAARSVGLSNVESGWIMHKNWYNRYIASVNMNIDSGCFFDGKKVRFDFGDDQTWAKNFQGQLYRPEGENMNSSYAAICLTDPGNEIKEIKGYVIQHQKRGTGKKQPSF